MDDALSIISLPDDPAALKAIIATISRQRDEVSRQRDEATRRHEDVTRRLEEAQLKALRLEVELARLKKWYYGPRADRLNVGQLLLEFAVALEQRPVNPQDLPPGTPVPPADAAPRRVRRGRRNIADFSKLPIIRQVHDLSDEEKPCPACDSQRAQIGQEITWQIEYFPGHFARIEHVQIKYACPPCDQNADNPQITLAAKPPQPIDKGMAGPGLLAYVITSKFADHLPLYRLESIFGRNGFEIDRSTMSVWAGDVADLLKPLHRLMIDRVLLSHVIATDETVLPMLPNPGAPGLAPQKTKQARMWVYLGDESHPYNLFDFTLSRSRDGPAVFLRNYGFDRLTAGNQVLLADAYGGYEGICIEKQIVQAGCWSHARRKFVDAQSVAPAITVEALGLIGKLFAIEDQAKPFNDAQRLELRRQQSLPVVEQLHERLLAWKQQLIPKHPMAQAIGYALNQWQPLTAFLSDGAIPIHNNLAEQQMKRIALGRKNFLFVGNERGGQTAAILSSITSTCRRHEINPQIYLTQLLANLPATPMSQLNQWLPDVWKCRQDPAAIADAHAKQ
jgi:transposase